MIHHNVKKNGYREIVWCGESRTLQQRNRVFWEKLGFFVATRPKYKTILLNPKRASFPPVPVFDAANLIKEQNCCILCESNVEPKVGKRLPE